MDCAITWFYGRGVTNMICLSKNVRRTDHAPFPGHHLLSLKPSAAYPLHGFMLPARGANNAMSHMVKQSE